MTTSTATIPVVDVGGLWGGPETVAQLATEITPVCHEIGFMVVTGHRVSDRLLDDVFAWMDAFFALPEDQKRSIDKVASPWFRGWEAVGSEYTNNRPDMREQIDLWTENEPRPRDVDPRYLRLLGPNQWPDADLVPGHASLRSLMDRWYAEMGDLASRLLGCLSVGLGLGPDHFERLFGDERMSLTKLIHYPPTPEGSAGVNAHHDAGFLTVLVPGHTPGLEIQMPDGTWEPIPAVPGGLVINLGEMLQGMTANYLVATPHRVITSEERLSAGYFHGPSLELALDPVPMRPELLAAVDASERHRAAGFMARKQETEAGVGDMQSAHKAATYGEQLWNYFSRSYPDNVARHHADLVTDDSGAQASSEA